jgi:RNA polymerase sigma-70 factor, ECF subfamily
VVFIMNLAAPLRVIPGGSDSEPSDDDLVRALVAGDAQALGRLIGRYSQTVFRVVRRYARSVEDARDLSQRTFLQAIEAVEASVPRFEAEGTPFPFKAWLLRIAVNLGKNHVRDAGRWPTVDFTGLELAHAAPRADDTYEAAQVGRVMREAVLALSPRQREVFNLRVDGALPFAEVAEVLGITEGNAKTHFHHAVKRLKDMVSAPKG